jgi:hypothetical protein
VKRKRKKKRKRKRNGRSLASHALCVAYKYECEHVFSGGIQLAACERVGSLAGEYSEQV